jgi:cell division protein FtsL
MTDTTNTTNELADLRRLVADQQQQIEELRQQLATLRRAAAGESPQERAEREDR